MNPEKLLFKTKIDRIFFVMHFGMLTIMLFFAIYVCKSNNAASIFNIVLGWFILALLFTIFSFFFLRIIIKDNFLFVHCFFIIYKVDIDTITKIKRGETMWFGLHKHGTATAGLIISSKFKNDLYITPQNEKVFLLKLMEINPTIIINKD